MTEIEKLYAEIADLESQIGDLQEQINDTDDRDEQASLREEKAELKEELDSNRDTLDELWEEAAEAMAAAPYQVLPPLTPKELTELRDSILEQGVLVPVDVDEQGMVLDGHHRLMIAEALGVDCPRRVVPGLADDGARLAYAVKVNVTRRHLTQKARQELNLKLRQEGWSIRRIAAETGVPKSTVSRDLAEPPVPGGTPAVDVEVEEATPAEVAAPVPGGTPARVTGEDGKTYPATRPKAEPKPKKPDIGYVQRLTQAVQTCLGEIGYLLDPAYPGQAARFAGFLERKVLIAPELRRLGQKAYDLASKIEDAQRGGQ